MRVAAVDIGTNTVRLLLAEVLLENGTVELLDPERHEVITRLGEGLDASGRLGAVPMGRALAGLEGYAGLIADSGIAVVGGVATAATRSAANGADFVSRVTDILGFAPRVIDGVEEARLTFQGATSHLVGAEIYCVVDVGGGSTEFVTGAEEPEYAASVDIGSVRLTDRIETLGLGNPDDIRRYVDGLFAEIALPIEPTVVLGSGGTFVTLAAVSRRVGPHDIEAMDDVSMSMDDVVATVDFIASMTPDQLTALPAVNPARAGVLLAGVICAERAIARVGASRVRVSVSDILDGVALELGAQRWPGSGEHQPSR
jgi:exopolyphosphatase/guanosine-5'-triphosphate,3'-diphosphate pyrophosphatase